MTTSLKIYAASLNPIIGNLAYNKELILASYERAQASKADVLIVNELATCGYPPLDLLDRPRFCEQVFKLNEEIAKSTSETTLIFGSFSSNPYKNGPKLINTAIIAQNGKIIGQAEKQLLPNYDVFDEKRYFREGQVFEPIQIAGTKVGIVICEDIWGNNNQRFYTRYTTDPVLEQKNRGAEVIFSLSASPYRTEKAEHRTALVQRHAKEKQLFMLDVNQAGANTELCFDGAISAADSEGRLIYKPILFQPQEVLIELSEQGNTLLKHQAFTASYQKDTFLGSSKYAQITEALKIGIADYVRKTKAADQIILGLSGGIDSALVAVLATEALGKDHVWALAMPTRYSSEGSVSDAKLLAQNLGIRFDIHEVDSLFSSYEQSLKPFFKNTEFNVAEENLQSRVRGTLLMALANKFRGMLLNTGNKSEMATGYCTLYGDMNGGLSVLGDLYKTEVFELCAWLNEVYFKKDIIPFSIINKPPSAELRPNQKDTDSLPDYEVLDKILSDYIDLELTREEIISTYGHADVVNKVCRLVDLNEYKRNQAPPILKLHPKSFGSGRRWPIVSQTDTA